MEIVNWKYYVVEKEISKIINKYISTHLKFSFNEYRESEVQMNSYLSWSLPKWGYSQVQSSISSEYLQEYVKPYTRRTFGGKYDFSLAQLNSLIRLKLRREKSEIVYEYADLIVECAVIFYRRYALSNFENKDSNKSTKKDLTAFMLVIDFLVIEVFYKVTILVKFALYEISQKLDDTTLSLFGESSDINTRFQLKPNTSLSKLDFTPKMSAWKSYSTDFSFYGKNTAAMQYKPTGINSSFKWDSYKFKI